MGPAALLGIWLGSPAVAGGNVLVVIADDISARELAVYSSAWPNDRPPPTPHIDALAARGVTFHGVHANPVCSPTRATMLTGRYSFRTGVGQIVKPTNSFDLELEETTFAELAVAAGLSTGLFGKWHLSSQGDPFTPPVFQKPHLHGFEDYRAGCLHGEITSYTNWQRLDNGTYSQETTYATTAQADACVEWIAAQEPGWLALLSFNAPHKPFHAPPAELLPSGWSTPVTDRARYVAAIAALDCELGRVLDAVDLDETTVVFVGDNGTPGEVAHPAQDPRQLKGTLYRESVEVPCIIAGRAVPSERWGTTDRELRSATDVFTAVLHAAGVDVPAGVAEDSLPMLTAPGRGFAFAERFSPLGHAPPESSRRMLRSTRFKLIRRNGVDRLYDLQADPGEDHDLLAAGPLSPEAALAHTSLDAGLAQLLSTR